MAIFRTTDGGSVLYWFCIGISQNRIFFFSHDDRLTVMTITASKALRFPGVANTPNPHSS